MKSGILTIRGCYAIDALRATSEIPFASVEVGERKLPEFPCPYKLPTVCAGEQVVIVSSWVHQAKLKGIDVINDVFIPLKQRFGLMIGVDQMDAFRLDFTEEMISYLDCLIKVNGVYKDRTLYNYVVGSATPNGCWSEKIECAGQVFSQKSLNKLHLSIPCFLSVQKDLRKKIRRFYNSALPEVWVKNAIDEIIELTPKPLSRRRPPRNTAHFVASLTHLQRAQAVQLLDRSGLKWVGGISGIPQYPTGMSVEARDRCVDELKRLSLLIAPRNRLGYRLSMLSCKAVLSITGIGELCFRMAEAWANRRVLVCQDLSHADIMYPLAPGKNVIYCKPDLSDLIEILEDVECNFGSYVDVAEQGYLDWVNWSRSYADHIREGFKPLYPQPRQ